MIGTYKGLEVIQMDVVKVITLTTLYFSVNYLLKFVLVLFLFYYWRFLMDTMHQYVSYIIVIN